MEKIKKILFICLLLCCCKKNVFAAPANNNFDDENFYKCIVDAYNNENNSSVSYDTDLTDEQLNTIESLSCSGRNKNETEKIVSTKGIEKLENLTNLKIYSHNISQLDISNNLKLKVLWADENKISNIVLDDLVHLQEVRLSGNGLNTISIKSNDALRELDLGFFTTYSSTTGGSLNKGNNITSIDLSGAPNLTRLYINNNELTEIDLSCVPKLQLLYIHSNKLTEIDLSKNTELSRLYLFDNKIPNINVSNLNNLEELSAGYNKLTEIDLSKNTKLSRLNLNNNKISNINVSNLNNLEYLFLKNNNLNNLDVSKNLELVYLEIGNNNIKEIDLSSNLKLEAFEAYNNGFMSLDLSMLDSLEELDSYDVNMKNYGIDNQTRKVQYTKTGNKYVIDLKNLDSQLCASNVTIEQEGIEYDSDRGIISFSVIPQQIEYKYNTGNDLDGYKYMTVSLTLDDYSQNDNEQSNEEEATINTDNEVNVNPQTGDTIMSSIIMLIISALGLASTLGYIVISNKRKLAKINN